MRLMFELQNVEHNMPLWALNERNGSTQLTGIESKSAQLLTRIPHERMATFDPRTFIESPAIVIGHLKYFSHV